MRIMTNSLLSAPSSHIELGVEKSGTRMEGECGKPCCWTASYRGGVGMVK